MVKMLQIGVVHGDCNEYNCIVEVDEDECTEIGEEAEISRSENSVS